MKLDVLNYDTLSTDQILEIYDRITFDNRRIRNKLNDIKKEIENLYTHDLDMLPYLLTEDELKFVTYNYNKEVDNTYIVKNLAKIGLYVKNKKGLYVIPLNISEGVNKALKAYLKNKKEIDDTKIIIYLILGLIRMEGAIKVEQLKENLLNYVEITDEQIDICYTHPLFNRFIKIDTYKEKKYLIPYELKDTDFDFVLYKTKNITKYNKFDLISCGKYFFNENSKLYQDAIFNPRIAYLLGKVDRADLILYSGSNNYEHDEYLKDYDLTDYTSDDFIQLDNFVRSLPSYIPVGENSLFISAIDSKNLDNIVSLLFQHARKTYVKDISGSYDTVYKSIQEAVVTHLDELIDDVISTYNISEDEEEFLLALKNRTEEEYAIYSLRKDGLILINTSTSEVYNVKIELSSYFRDHSLRRHFANAILANYKGQIVMITYNFIENLSKSDSEYFKEILKDNKDKIIKKL